jgi:hypothetical protein
MRRDKIHFISQFWVRYPDIPGFQSTHWAPGLLSNLSKINNQFIDTQLFTHNSLIAHDGTYDEASTINQAKFLRDFLNRAEQENLTYYVVEAFDQPWKLLSNLSKINNQFIDTQLFTHNSLIAHDGTYDIAMICAGANAD